jgi:tripartite ATP-independent transporter DctM subunit
VYRETGLKELINVFIETGRETANIGFLISASAFYGWVLARSGVTIYLTDFFSHIAGDAIYVLLIINVFLLFVGCFMEPTTAILIMGTILMPVIKAFGIDPVHFGVVMILNLMIGMLTPPFGVILYVMQNISNISFSRVFRGTAKFYLPLIAVLLLITIFPSIVLYLPKLIIW